MKTQIKTASLIVVFAVLLLQGCLSCYTCDRDNKKAICIKPNDTLIFNQDSGSSIHRYYPGGDSLIFVPIWGRDVFEKTVQAFTDSGYVCSSSYTGNHNHVKNCRRGGDDDLWVDPAGYEYSGYSCNYYKGHL